MTPNLSLVDPAFVGIAGAAGGAPNIGVFIFEDEIEYINTGTLGNADIFGATNIPNVDGGATGGSGTYGLVGGNYTGEIARWTFASTGSSIDWGNMYEPRKDTAGCSNDITYCVGAGYKSSATNIITNIASSTIDTTGNSSNFGDLSQARYGLAALSNATRGIWGGGYTGAGSLQGVSTQDYVTFASGGTATSAGNLIGTAKWLIAGCSNSTYGFWGGGYQYSSQMQQTTMASLGVCLDYGDLLVGSHLAGALASENRAVYGGGGAASGATDRMDWKTFDNSGTAEDFGDLSFAGTTCGCSDLVRT